jgi:hypothetical protein
MCPRSFTTSSIRPEGFPFLLPDLAVFAIGDNTSLIPTMGFLGVVKRISPLTAKDFPKLRLKSFLRALGLKLVLDNSLICAKNTSFRTLTFLELSISLERGIGLGLTFGDTGLLTNLALLVVTRGCIQVEY